MRWARIVVKRAASSAHSQRYHLSISGPGSGYCQSQPFHAGDSAPSLGLRYVRTGTRVSGLSRDGRVVAHMAKMPKSASWYLALGTGAP
jgi:hypothetical protein